MVVIKTNFKEWIKQYEEDPCPQGNLARDIGQDPDFPADETNGDRIREYLKSKGACYAALKVADAMVFRYRAYNNPSKMEQYMEKERAALWDDREIEKSEFEKWQEEQKIKKKALAEERRITRQEMLKAHDLQRAQERSEDAAMDEAIWKRKIMESVLTIKLNERAQRKEEEDRNKWKV